MSLVRREGRIRYLARDANGADIAHGVLASGVHSAMTLAVADYGLLGVPGLMQHSRSQRLCLLPPDPSLDGAAVADLWAGIPSRARNYLAARELEELRPYLEPRRTMLSVIDDCLQGMRQVLESVSTEYLDVLAPNGSFIPEVIPLLREYPSPAHLSEAGPIRLTHRLRTAFPTGRSQVIDQLHRLRESVSSERADRSKTDFAAFMIPVHVEHYLLLARQLGELDDHLYDRALRFGAGQGHDAFLLQVPASRLASTGRDAQARFDSRVADRSDRARMIEQAEAILSRRFDEVRHPQTDYREYLDLRSAMKFIDAPADSSGSLRMEIIGQLLAMSSGDLLDAVRHSDFCEVLLSPQEQESWTIADDEAARLRADAALAMAITDVVAVGTLEGFPALRSAIESDSAACATPELLAEAHGLFALCLVLFGELHADPGALDSARALAAQHGRAGASRACADLTELLLASMRPESASDELRERRDAADGHTRGTPYRSFFNYIMMLSSYVSKDTETGLLRYSEIIREGIWERFSPRFFRLARLAYVALLSSKGDLAAARRELRVLESGRHLMVQGAERIILAASSLRLDLAAGRHAEVLKQTGPGGALAEQNLTGLQMRRYMAVTLMLQGTALMREGSAKLAEAAFLRLTQFSAVSGEWLPVLGVETPEYRAWLRRLDRENLPSGLARETYDAILARPIFIDCTLPVLTQQQTRILEMLARGRSTQSIAAELHITNNTMKSHLRRLYQRLEVGSREQAVTCATAYGLLS